MRPLDLSLKEKAPLDMRYIIGIPGFCVWRRNGSKIVPNWVTAAALSCSLQQHQNIKQLLFQELMCDKNARLLCWPWWFLEWWHRERYTVYTFRMWVHQQAALIESFCYFPHSHHTLPSLTSNDLLMHNYEPFCTQLLVTSCLTSHLNMSIK